MANYSRRSSTSSSFPLVALITLLALAFHLKTCNASKAHTYPKSATEFIRTSCGVTPYPRVCFASLSSYSGAIESSPKQLATTALTVSLKGAKSTWAFMSNLSEGHGLKRKEVGAMKDCVKTVSDSVDQIQRSLSEMGHLNGPDVDFHISNIRTWVSAALTDDDTCTDGFAGKAMNDKVKSIVRGHVLYVARLTSNALALVTNLASIQAKLP